MRFNYSSTNTCGVTTIRPNILQIDFVSFDFDKNTWIIVNISVNQFAYSNTNLTQNIVYYSAFVAMSNRLYLLGGTNGGSNGCGTVTFTFNNSIINGKNNWVII